MLSLKFVPINHSPEEILLIREKVLMLPDAEMTSKYQSSKFFENSLSNEIKIVLKYLLAKDVHCRIPLYALFSEKIKIGSLDNYYVWRANIGLWTQKFKTELGDTDLLYVMDECFRTYRRIINDLDVEEENGNKSQICTKAGIISILDEQLILSKTKKVGIVESYIEYMIDDDFKKKLDPKNFIAVKGKKIVNLITGEIRDRDITDYCTKEVSVDLLNKVISEICLFDNDIIELIERIFGYILTGTCQEGKIFIFQGETLAGKSIIINLLQDTLGHGYSTFLNKNVIMNKKKEDNGTDPFVHQLVGKRLGIINETDESDVINPGKTKVIATNEPYMYRLLHSNNIQMLSASYGLILTTNNRPKMLETDESIWRRLMLIPFSAKFVEFPTKENEFKVDMNLRDILKDTKIKEAFLNKLIQAAIKYNKEGLGKIPEKVTRALEKYQKETDVIKQFSKEFLIVTDDKKDTISATKMWRMFKEKYKNNMSQKEFGKKIKDIIGESVKNGAGLKEYRKVKYV
jgi:P4 family phage/plasmid primase-like protien